MANMNEYDLGDVVRCTGTFTNAGGTAVDPGTVQFSTKDPSGTIDTYTYGTDPELLKSATGIYYSDVTIDEIGLWKIRFLGTGSNAAAGEDKFSIRASEFD